MTIRRGSSTTLTPAQRKGIDKSTFVSDVESNGAGMLERFPVLSTLSLRNQMMMIGYAMGYSIRQIAECMELDSMKVWRTIKKIDPDGLFKKDIERRKAILSERYVGKSEAALNAMTDEKLEECSAPALAKVGKVCAETAGILARKTLTPAGDGKIKKVVVTFRQVSYEMENDRKPEARIDHDVQDAEYDEVNEEAGSMQSLTAGSGDDIDLDREPEYHSGVDVSGDEAGESDFDDENPAGV
jgi:DNA-binding Lrp family transcriptional regulator